MRLIDTAKNSILCKSSIILIITLFISLFSFYACSSSSQDNLYKDSHSEKELNKDNVKTFTFQTNENGQRLTWKALFEDGKITDLFRNDKKIPPNEIENYKDMVYKNIDDITKNHDEYDAADIHINMNNFNKGMKRFHHWMANLDSTDFDFHFDKKAFEKGMKHLDKELSRLKDFKFEFHFDSAQCFDTAKFNKSMRKLKQSLKHMKFDNHDFECNMSALKENMKNLKEKLRHLHFNRNDFEIDMSHLKDEMKKLKGQMKDFKFEMNGFKEKMKKFGTFMKDLKHEMVKDGLIQNSDEDINLEFNSTEMKVNGKKVPEKFFEKYKKMYKDYFGKDIKDGFRIDLR